jgi:hypothetical protein
MNRRASRKVAATFALLFAAGAILVLLDPRSSSVPAGSEGEALVERAWREQRSDVWVEVEGRVIRLLRDDTRGSRHQKFLIELAGGHTLLVSHNIDLAPRVPVEVGDRLSVRGEYVWNDRGGLLHWTHHDPQGRTAGGWVRLQDETYR